MQPWLKFFRAVNLPTVPGDVLVGVAAVVWGTLGNVSVSTASIVSACLASIFLYLFGLADNDIVGAKKDGSERPIPAGEISLGAARMARGLCLLGVMIFGVPCGALWWPTAFLLVCTVVVYNRTKFSLAMGLCRGLNVACGGLVIPLCGKGFVALMAAAILWTLYITAVTMYSTGEEADPAKRRRVGFLIGALVYLQLGALLFFYLQSPCLALRNLLLVGAGLLILLRLMKRALPKVSAS